MTAQVTTPKSRRKGDGTPHARVRSFLFRCQNETIKNFIFDGLAKQGILIRDQSKQLNLSDCLRISIGSEDELNLLMQSIRNSFASEKINTNNEFPFFLSKNERSLVSSTEIFLANHH